MSELPPGVPRAEPPAPRDSASAIVVRRVASGEWELLLGLRSRSARFMPGHLACPGGGLESSDGGAFERCASRELHEETGVDVPASSWIEAGWRTTPPMFPVRFHTRFFAAELPRGVETPRPATEENESLRFARPADVLAEWAAGRARLPPPILPIVRALDAAAAAPLPALASAVAEANAQEERAPRIEFAPDVWMLPVGSATLPPATHTNVWMPGGRDFVVIDPGAADEGEIERLLAVVERRRALGHRPVGVLLTHQHQDHTSGVRPVATALGVPVRAHPDTLAAIGPAWRTTEYEPLRDGETIDLRGMTLIARHTPGHASGHLAFQLPERSLLIAGDLISGLSTILIDPQQGDMQAYLESLARAAALDCKLLLPGHGPPLAGRQLAKLIEHRNKREQRILVAVGQGCATVERIADAAYVDTPGLPRPLIEGQTLAHLRGLARRSRVRQQEGNWLRGPEP